MLTLPRCAFRSRYFRKGSTQVHRRGARALGRLPRNRAIKRPVNFECGWAVSVARQLALVACRQTMTREAQKLSGCDIAQNGTRGRQLINGLDARLVNDLTAEFTQVRS